VVELGASSKIVVLAKDVGRKCKTKKIVEFTSRSASHAVNAVAELKWMVANAMAARE